jgi:hypothetical protein
MDEVSWLCGIIDGEGCLTIRILLRKTKNYGIRPRFQPQLTIVNTDESLMQRCSDVFESIHIKHRLYSRNRKSKGKIMYCIDVFATGLREFLPMVKDHLCKKEEAEILLQALELTEKNKSANHGGIHGRIPMPYEVLTQFDELRNKLVGLHGRQASSLIKLEAAQYNLDSEKKEELKWLKV